MGQEGESACVHNGVETREGLCSKMDQGMDDQTRSRRGLSQNDDLGARKRSRRRKKKSKAEKEGK